MVDPTGTGRVVKWFPTGLVNYGRTTTVLRPGFVGVPMLGFPLIILFGFHTDYWFDFLSGVWAENGNIEFHL